ncbi:AAA family ATPase [Spirulina sp. CS-785/01]|uniref:AAA family ATPase n=1 Tax=Spirulina sp. CS-785/01 TaxID=3021716 RepID=UPI00232BDAE5|nr:AAA family ATPase [Spirulina sp. CS-785/01]MDB9313505.1 AAA family ATPase [Spirulina sp. CS-785/01]
MTFSFPGNDKENQERNQQNKGLLGSGWRPLERELDWDFLFHLTTNDTLNFAQKTLDFASDVADALGRQHYAWWANILNIFSERTQEQFNEYWEYLTPAPPFPDQRHGEIITVETPVKQMVNRNSIPIDYVLNRLQEITLFKILDLLGKPDLITQYYLDRYFYYPVERFSIWPRLEVVGTVYAYWSEPDIWLEIYAYERGRRCYTLIAQNMTPLVNKATYNLAVMLSGYQSRVGQVQSQYPIRSFPQDIQDFTDGVQQAILNQDQLAVLVQGQPGTGKTAWTQAVAKEILMPLGYVVFILDHDAVENFVPPSYLEKICIIINEADNLAQDRSSAIAQQSSKTEHILGLLDGTLYQSVVEESEGDKNKQLVVLMTCNTTERLDPAMLRKGRVDLTCQFLHKFV